MAASRDWLLQKSAGTGSHGNLSTLAPTAGGTGSADWLPPGGDAFDLGGRPTQTLARAEVGGHEVFRQTAAGRHFFQQLLHGGRLEATGRCNNKHAH